MPKITKNSINVGDVYSSNSYGDFEVIEMLPPRRTFKEDGTVKDTERMCRIKFLNSGTIMDVMVRNAKKGNVKDPYFPSICGVACVGMVKVSREDAKKFPFTNWNSMILIHRCYDKNNILYHVYGGAGITVCERWLCYENFLQDIPNLPGYDKIAKFPNRRFTIDKDFLQQGLPSYLKVYSPTTCIWMSVEENAMFEAIHNKDRFKNEYFCVNEDRGKFRVRIRNRFTGLPMDVGYYDDIIAAVNMANYANYTIGNPMFINQGAQPMHICECLQHRLGNHPNMCNVYDNICEVIDDQK